MPVAQDSLFGKAEGESGTEEYMGRAEAGDDSDFTQLSRVFSRPLRS